MASDDILARIDAATVANLCGCGCGNQIAPGADSPDFVNEAHQHRWNNRGRTGKGLTEGGVTAARAQIEARNAEDTTTEPPTSGIQPCGIPGCDGVHRYNARLVTLTIQALPDRKASTLRRAIDKIRGAIR